MTTPVVFTVLVDEIRAFEITAPLPPTILRRFRRAVEEISDQLEIRHAVVEFWRELFEVLAASPCGVLTESVGVAHEETGSNYFRGFEIAPDYLESFEELCVEAGWDLQLIDYDPEHTESLPDSPDPQEEPAMTLSSVSESSKKTLDKLFEENLESKQRPPVLPVICLVYLRLLSPDPHALPEFHTLRLSD